MLDSGFDYENYIQKRLKEIDDLDERRFAKELLTESLGKVLKCTESKYDALEKRIQNELDVPWKNFHVFMTVIDRKDYDPINDFWFPVWAGDTQTNVIQEYKTIYLEADEETRQEFAGQKTLTGTDPVTGRTVRFRIERADRYWKSMEKLYTLFANNHISWQTLHLGHIERFFDLIPEEEISSGEECVFQFGRWDACIRNGRIPLWNIQDTAIRSGEFRRPCIDEVFYEHVFYLSEEQATDDGYLVDSGEEILSMRYEKNKIMLKTEKEQLENVFLYRLRQAEPEMSVGYRYPVLSNRRNDNLTARYLHRMGNFLQTPMELSRKIEEMSGDHKITVLDYEIIDGTEEALPMADKMLLSGDMNEFAMGGVFSKDTRRILLFRIKREEQGAGGYLYESQIRYILSQMQMEFLEYRCVGVID